MPPETSSETKPSDALKPLRTYQSDVEELMHKTEVSKATIVIAEAKKTLEKKAEPEPEPRNTPALPVKIFSISGALPLGTRWNVKLIVVVVVGILVLTSIGVGAFYFLRGDVPPETPPVVQETQKAIGVELQGKEGRAGVIGAIQETVQSISVPQSEVRTVPLKVGDVPLTTTELLGRLETKAPPTLVRALLPTPLLGIHGFKGGQTFLLLGVTSFDNAFAGMLAWEPTLLDDIGPLFNISSRGILNDVGSTTAKALSNTIVIKDVIIRNKDARAAFDPQGVIVFLYAFLDKQTLVFTTNEDTLRMLQSKAGGGKLR
ncbi:MAG: hypothetical protein EXS51_00105 [Candidatus Taylorbacteria bacterium]|nr:hypothetical protein [Candidatus Taylorbacteria bacterium]